MVPVRLRFYYAKHDVIQGYRLHFRNTLNLPLTFIVSCVSIALGIFYISYGSGTDVGYLLIVLPLLLLGILMFVLVIFPRILYRRDTKYGKEYTIDFSDNGVTFIRDSDNSPFNWAVYTRAVENRFAYILYFGRNDFTIIPKRLFTDREEETNFRKLLAEKSLLY